MKELARETLTVPPKTILLREGDVAQYIYFIEKGALRTWFNKDGKDVTTQFFLEGDSVASLESAFKGEPSLYSLESMETTQLSRIKIKDFQNYLDQNPELKERFYQKIISRLISYQKRFLSHLKDSPQERYEILLREQPHLLQRIPQHYLASYLGITPVSLSRIRSRK
jgi:CRP-like cAMP-binding protein